VARLILRYVQDYHWWWRSFFVSGSTAVYLFLYSVFCFVTQLTFHGFVNTFLYFAFSLMITIAMFVMTGMSLDWYMRCYYWL
jgi:hypothetical protein